MAEGTYAYPLYAAPGRKNRGAHRVLTPASKCSAAQVGWIDPAESEQSLKKRLHHIYVGAASCASQ